MVVLLVSTNWKMIVEIIWIHETPLKDSFQGFRSPRLETPGPHNEYKLTKHTRLFKRWSLLSSLALPHATHSHIPHAPTALNHLQFHKYTRFTLRLCTWCTLCLQYPCPILCLTNSYSSFKILLRLFLIPPRSLLCTETPRVRLGAPLLCSHIPCASLYHT